LKWKFGKEEEREKETCTRKERRKRRWLLQKIHAASIKWIINLLFIFFQFYNNNGYFSQRHKGIYNKFKLFLSKEILLKWGFCNKKNVIKNRVFLSFYFFVITSLPLHNWKYLLFNQWKQTTLWSPQDYIQIYLGDLFSLVER
jgi:hypothetical protein